MTVIAKNRNAKNQNIPKVFEIGCEIALNSDIPNALKNPNKWIIPCIPINMIKAIRIVFSACGQRLWLWQVRDFKALTFPFSN